MRTLVALSLTVAVAGCSRPAPRPAQNAAAAPAPAAVSASDAAACGSRPIGQADVQPLLSGPITSVKPAPSGPDTCMFSTANFSSILVTVRPDGGRETVKSWRKGPVTPLAGVGDDAVWEPDLKEVVAAKGDTLCTVTAMGPETAPATAQAEGAVCGKVFAGL